jgi:hypothetical protein
MLKFNGKESPELQEEVKSLVAQRIASTKYRREDVEYVKSLDLFPVKDASNLDNEMLERLRRISEVWEVKLGYDPITSHRPIIGPLIVALKRMIFPLVSLALKKPLEQQRRFNAEVVSMLARLASR